MRRKCKEAAEPVETDETKEVKTKPEKLPKGVKVLDSNTMLPIIFRVKSIPEQSLRAKIAHDKCFIIGDSAIDRKNERFIFEVVQGIDLIPTYVTFKEACEMFGWKSFSFEMGGQTVVPVWCDKGADEI